jgi:uncharacterized protein YcgI (DUF1989 family)
MRTGRGGLQGCHLQLLKAIEPFGLNEDDIRDTINLFQNMRLDPRDGRLYAAKNDSKAWDYVEFYVEIDLLVAVSVCPGGDNTRDWTTPTDGTVLPLGIALYDTGVEPKEFPKRVDWRHNWTGKWIAS